MPLAPETLAGQRILITGGGSGLGLAMARHFASLGAELAICGRREAVLAAAAAELGPKARWHRCDVRDPAQVEAMLDALWPLDILVNNAAGNFLAQSHRLSPRAVDAVIDIVLKGSTWCTLGCGRRWIAEARPGTVLSILTLSALQGGAFTLPSAMAKAGVLAMTRSLAVEWGPHGIRLVAIAPGAFPTEGATSRLRTEAMGAATQGIPLGRAGQHREIADLAAFLVSDLAGYMTGEAVVIDGGKRFLGGARSGVEAMLGWDDAAWDTLRAKQPR
jgi:NAD(P)-dependent dehydrogenase (short-subunit alcohol dehydrogenase family)